MYEKTVNNRCDVVLNSIQNPTCPRIEVARPVRVFSAWALEKLNEDPLFHRQILFSNEARFWLDGYLNVNKQNFLIRGDAHPEIIQEQLLHPAKCSVWCGLWAGGIIGPYFVKNQAGRNVTVNGSRYRYANGLFIART
ncbi:hypothetical protein JTB14_031630 [Gonioctena quinquepunctata]|nr:hypothetical protein JTB14_031630 [Gonioctena quinquepunctata]